MKNSISIAIILAIALACSNSEPVVEQQHLQSTYSSDLHLAVDIEITGTKYAEATIAAQAAYNRLVKNLKMNEAISIVAEVDHQKNAKSVGLDLDYTQLVLFGNPVLGTPLMQRNQLAGLDLPQKVLFFVDGNKNDIAIYNSVEYLSSRHGLEGVSTLPQISQALENLVEGATKSEVQTVAEQTVAEGEGIITKDSSKDFSNTYGTLYDAVSNNPNLKIIAELDHQANAARVGLELPPTKILIFGNPNLGTPLMQSNQTVGLDLPQKMLVWEDENGVHVSYNDPFYLADRHHLSGVDAQLETIATALDNLSNVATSE